MLHSLHQTLCSYHLIVHVMGFKTCWVPGYGSLGYGSGSAFSHPCLTHTQTLGLVGFLASLIARNLPPNVSHTPPQDPQMCLQTHTVDTLKWALQMCPSNAHSRHPQCPQNVPLKCTSQTCGSTPSMPSCAPLKPVPSVSLMPLHMPLKCAPQTHMIDTVDALAHTPQACAINTIDTITHAPQTHAINALNAHITCPSNACD